MIALHLRCPRCFRAMCTTEEFGKHFLQLVLEAVLRRHESSLLAQGAVLVAKYIGVVGDFQNGLVLLIDESVEPGDFSFHVSILSVELIEGVGLTPDLG